MERASYRTRPFGLAPLWLRAPGAAQGRRASRAGTADGKLQGSLADYGKDPRTARQALREGRCGIRPETPGHRRWNGGTAGEGAAGWDRSRGERGVQARQVRGSGIANRRPGPATTDAWPPPTPGTPPVAFTGPGRHGPGRDRGASAERAAGAEVRARSLAQGQGSPRQPSDKRHPCTGRRGEARPPGSHPACKRHLRA
jgi:hypothetical protein